MLRNKRHYLFLISFFFLMISSVLPFWIIRGQNPYERSWLEGRYLVDFQLLNRGFFRAMKDLIHGNSETATNLFTQQFILRDFQKDMEKAALDQFPFRFNFIQIAKSADRGVIDLAYAFLPDPAIPAGMQSEFFITRDHTAILYGPSLYEENTLRRIDSRIANYAALIEGFPDIHFYVYYIERIQNSPYHPLNGIAVNLERGQYFDYFIENAPTGMVIDKFDITSYEDHLKYFYHTDHHWNIHGILRAYEEIYALLEQNFTDISEQKVYHDFITFSDIYFQGSESRKSYQPLGEPFSVVDYALGPYRVYENGQEIVYGNSADYLRGIYPKDPYYNHYEGFYGGDKGLMWFEFPNNPDRNLLVIGNSYDNALLPLIASHYHLTYDVDLRYYPDLKLSEFLEEHPVDDVLVIGENSFAFSSPKYGIQP